MDPMIVELQGQVFAFQLLVVNALGNIAQEKADPIGFLGRVRTACIEGTKGIVLPGGNSTEVEEVKRIAIKHLDSAISVLQEDLRSR